MRACVLITTAVILLTACKGKDADNAAMSDEAQAALKQATGIDASGDMPVGTSRSEQDLGGKFDLKLSGGITASEESKETSVCVQEMGTGDFKMRIYSLRFFDAKYMVVVSAINMQPAAGKTYPIGGDDPMNGITAEITDMTHGKDATEWEMYKDGKGEVTFTDASVEHAAGKFTFTGKPEKNTALPVVTASGTFDAKQAEACKAK